MLTFHNNDMQNGLNPDETVLTPSNVNSADFGKLFSISVDGKVYAQPLYMFGLTIPGQGTCNVLFVATSEDSVYAFNADNGITLWNDSFINPAAGVTAVPVGDLPHTPVPMTGDIGIYSTPVIDPSTNTLYAVAYTKEVSGSTTSYVYRLHAIDITTGAENFGGPVVIQASVNGTGDGNDGNGQVIFNPQQQDQRDGLLLLNGVVYFGFAAWGGNESSRPWHGWFLGYNSQNLQQVAVFSNTPNGYGGGIWEGSGGLATDGTYIYLMTGNGTFDATLNSNGFPTNGDFADSFLKIAADPSTSPTNQNIDGWGVKVVDYFTPSDQATLESKDLDMGSGGVTLLPDQAGAHAHELLGAGKEGTIFLVDRDNMGHFDPNANHVVQELDGALGANFGTPAYFNGLVYFGGSNDPLKAFAVTNGLLSTSPVSQSVTTFPNHGTTPSVSANDTSNGIVWSLKSDASGGNTMPAVLHAYDATNLSNELYNSTQVPGRDQAAVAVSFIPPTIADGKVYVPTQSEIDVYGLQTPILDPGFELVQVGAGQFQYDPTGSPWTFSGQAGISANNSTLTSGNPPAPGGSQVAFLESTGSFSQSTTNWATGSYSISFSAAQRAERPGIAAGLQGVG